MSDNVPVTAGSGTTVATDDVSGVHYQRFKLTDGTADSSTPIPGSANGLYVDPHPATTQIQVASTGLTTATTAYTANDQLGAQLTFANAVRVSGGTGIVQSAVLVDKARIVGAVDLYLFDRSVTLASDNAAAGVSDADALFCQGVISLPSPSSVANNYILSQSAIGLGIKMNATSLYVSMVTRAGHTFFGAAGDLVLTLTILQD